MKTTGIIIVNPAVLTKAVAGGLQGCGQYSDAPVCQNGNQDVICTGERYRGCAQGASDCADTDPNPDDDCCWGWGYGAGDNIDHQFCRLQDAGWGSTCIVWDGCGQNDYI